MAYSFVLVEVPPEVDALRKQAAGYFEGDSSMKASVDRYYSAIEPYSFHCNLSGVGYLRSTMRRLEMLAEGEPKPFPKYPSWDPESYQSAGEHRLANPAVWTAYEAAEQSAMRQRATGTGIARFKLMTNGPWVVVAEEVAQALARYRALAREGRPSSEPDALWSDWIHWLTRASAGFEVT